MVCSQFIYKIFTRCQRYLASNETDDIINIYGRNWDEAIGGDLFNVIMALALGLVRVLAEFRIGYPKQITEVLPLEPTYSVIRK